MTVRWYNPETQKMEDYRGRLRPDSPFFIMPMFQEYEAVGTDGRLVKTREDHKNMLKEFGAEEIGNEKPAWLDDQQRERAEKGKENA